MSKSQINGIVAAVGIAAVLGLSFYFVQAHQKLDRQAADDCLQIGLDLIAKTNSSQLTSLQPPVKKRLEEFFVSPARVEAALPGDEARPSDSPKATARVFLINNKNERLGLRFGKEQDNKYRVLGYWIPEVPPPAKAQ